MSVVVVGSLNVDLNVTVERLPAPGETLLGSGGRTSPGGKGANQALAAALRGAEVHMVGAVGDDANAAVALSRLSQTGVDTSLVARLDAPTGLAVCSVDGAGQNTIVVVPGANGLVGSAQVEAAAGAIAGASVLVLQGEVPAGAVDAAVRAACGQAAGGGGLAGGAHGHGSGGRGGDDSAGAGCAGTRSAGTGSAAKDRAGAHGRPRILLNLAPVIPLDARVVRLADPLVVNEHEGRLVLRDVFGIAPDPLERQDDPDVAVARALLGQGLAAVVMTLGERGAVALEAGDPCGLLAFPSPRVAVVDTVGAGDAFVGALAACLAAGGSLAQAVEAGVRVGAYACTGRGAQDSYPGPGDELPR